MTLRLGIYLNSQHPEADDPSWHLAALVEQVKLAAELGFDSIWAGEHHLTPVSTSSPSSRSFRTLLRSPAR